jgi:actin-related protein 2
MLRSSEGLVDVMDKGIVLKDLMIGHEANAARSMLSLQHPIENGMVKNWDDMEAIWDHTFAQLGINPADHAIVQTEAALNPKKNRERIVETMFEKYGFNRVNVSVQAILALKSRGRDSGFVVDSGDGVTHLVPVTSGYLEPSLVSRINLAGRHVTEYLMKLLQKQGYPLNSSADFETVREIKQKCCYVAHDLQAERKLAQETTVVDTQYTMPNSRVMRMRAERFLAPEILFNPGLQGHGEGEGLAEAVFNTIRKSDMHVQKDYFSHIILSGGTTMFPGMSSRMEKDIRQLYFDQVLKGDTSRRSGFKCHVIDPPDRQHMVFMGASLLSEAAEAQGNSPWFITRKEYDEAGVSLVERLIPTQLH